MTPSPGVFWAKVMLALMVVEVLVLIEVLFFDSSAMRMNVDNSFTTIYFYACVATTVLQIIGIVLVKKGQYKRGGIVQIVASAMHALKLEGLIGIMGGMQAMDYPDELKSAEIENKKTASL